MSLHKILNEMEQNRPNAEMDVTLGNPSTERGRSGLKRAATETIKRLKLDYRNKLSESTVFIVVTGTGREQFTELASSDSFGCFAVDPEDFFKDLANRISPPSVKPSLFGRENPKNLFNVAQNVLRDRANELDIDSYPALYFNDKYNANVATTGDFVPLLRSAFVDQVGLEMVGLSAIHSIVDKAIQKKHTASVTPIVFSTSDEKYALDLKNNLKKHVQKDGTKA